MMQSSLGFGLRPRTGDAPHYETHNEQDAQEPHTDVAKGEPRLGVSVVGPTSYRFSNLSEREVAEDNCQQRGREKKEGHYPTDQTDSGLPVGTGSASVRLVADRSLQRCSAMLAGPKSLLIFRPTTPAIHRNLRFEPVARTSYAPAALHTTNIQPEHGLVRSLRRLLATRKLS